LTVSQGVKAQFFSVIPAPGFRRDRVAGIQSFLVFLDSGPFDKPFENLRVLSNVEGLRVPSLSRDFRRNDRKERFRVLYETGLACT
jgi:hypothetical protein